MFQKNKMPSRGRVSKGGKSAKTEQKFEIGDKIWAKIKGFPYWPARVDEIDDKKGKYRVFFYGTHEQYEIFLFLNLI